MPAHRHGHLALYRGVSAVSPASGRFYHPDVEFARQFTRSGLDREIVRALVDPREIDRPDPLPYGGDPDAIDAAVTAARERGFRAVWCDEGAGGSPSVYVFDRECLRDVRRLA